MLLRIAVSCWLVLDDLSSVKLSRKVSGLFKPKQKSVKGATESKSGAILLSSVTDV